MNRRSERLMSQMRAGKCPLFQDYLFTIGKSSSPNCVYCRDKFHRDVVESIEHVLCRCPQYATKRKEFLGDNVKVKILAHSPKQVIEFIEAIHINGFTAPSDVAGG